MKKLSTTFFLVSALFTSNLCALSGPEIPADKFYTIAQTNTKTYTNEGYMNYENCKYINRNLDDDDEFLYAGDTISGRSYESGNDSLECPNGRQVCILGESIVDDTIKNNNCWVSVIDTWNDKWESSETTLPDCDTSSGPWTKYSSEKIPVFVNKRNQIMQTVVSIEGTDTTLLIKSIVGNNPLEDNDVQCVAYICKSDDKYSYGCSDGFCTESCPELEPEPEPGPDPAPEPTPGNTTPVHRNTVKPYLDALKQKYGIK